MEKTYQYLKLTIWVLLFAVLIAGAWVLYNRLSPQMAPQLSTQPTQGEVSDGSSGGSASTEQTAPLAPEFTVYDAQGQAVNLSDYLGKPVILNFWASWCGPCKSEMPAFQKAWETYGEQIHFLMVNLTDNYQETTDKASAFLADAGYTFPVFFDTDMDAAISYGITGIPVTFFLDSDGRIVTGYSGALTESLLQQGVDMLLA